MKSGTWAETTLLIRWICIIGDDPRQFMIDFTSGRNLFHSSCSQRIWACVIGLFTWIWALALYSTDFRFPTKLSLKHRVSSLTYQRFSFLFLPVNKKGPKKIKIKGARSQLARCTCRGFKGFHPTFFVHRAESGSWQTGLSPTRHSWTFFCFLYLHYVQYVQRFHGSFPPLKTVMKSLAQKADRVEPRRTRSLVPTPTWYWSRRLYWSHWGRSWQGLVRDTDWLPKATKMQQTESGIFFAQHLLCFTLPGNKQHKSRYVNSTNPALVYRQG